MTEKITDKKVMTALAEVIREKLVSGEDVHITGLGTFRVHHQISRIEESPDGSSVMKPPRDVIAFSSDR